MSLFAVVCLVLVIKTIKIIKVTLNCKMNRTLPVLHLPLCSLSCGKEKLFQFQKENVAQVVVVWAMERGSAGAREGERDGS